MTAAGLPQFDLHSFAGRQSLREQVAVALRAALVAGEMRPGAVYSAPVLAERFGVSATPVREAMLDLAKEGLVEVVPNKGFRPTELSDRDLDEITEVRILLEVPAVMQLADHFSAKDADRLRPLAQDIVDASRHRDLIRHVEADRRFHLELLALGGNRHLVSVVEDLRKRSRLFGLSRLAERGTLVPSAQEHEQLLDLLVRGDIKAVEQLMRRHLGHVRGAWAGRHEVPAQSTAARR